MSWLGERDPEEVGPEHPEDLELRMDVQASIHDFVAGPDGRCIEHLVRHGRQGAVCRGSEWSVLHRGHYQGGDDEW